MSSLPNKTDLKTTTNELTQKCKGDDTSSDYENDEDIDHPYVCIFCKKGFMDRDRLNTFLKNCRRIRLSRSARLIPERQEWV